MNSETDISVQSQARQDLESDLRLIRDVVAGTRIMRQRGETYLPKYINETQKAYEFRLSLSTMYPGLQKALEASNGHIFADEISVEEQDPKMQEWMGDVDLSGKNVNLFAQELFRDTIEAGISYVIVDLPRPDALIDDETNTARRLSQADVERFGIRPYWRHFKLEDVLGWRTTNVNGREVVSQLRVQVKYTMDDELYEQDEVFQIWVYELDKVSVFQKTDPEDARALTQTSSAGHSFVSNEHGMFVEIPNSPMPNPSGKINIVPFYGGQRLDLLSAKSMYTNIAWMNVSIWQSESQQQNALSFSRFPMLFLKKINAEEDANANSGAGSPTVPVGPNITFYGTDDSSDARWIEAEGKALLVGSADIESRKKDLDAMALQMLSPITLGDMTATQSNINRKNAVAPLEAVANGFIDQFNLLLRITAELGQINPDNAGEVQLNMDLDVPQDIPSFDSVLKLFEVGALTKASLQREAKRRGLLDPDMDLEEEMLTLMSEEPVDELITTGPPIGEDVEPHTHTYMQGDTQTSVTGDHSHGIDANGNILEADNHTH
jgi:hypothetical protein